jgi:hypothetical protein
MNSAKKYIQDFLASHVAAHCSTKRKQIAKRKAIRDSSTGFLNNPGAKTNFNHIDLQLRGFR